MSSSLRLIRLWRKGAASKAQRPETTDRGPEIEDGKEQSSFQKSFFPSSVIRHPSWGVRALRKELKVEINSKSAIRNTKLSLSSRLSVVSCPVVLITHCCLLLSALCPLPSACCLLPSASCSQLSTLSSFIQGKERNCEGSEWLFSLFGQALECAGNLRGENPLSAVSTYRRWYTFNNK